MKIYLNGRFLTQRMTGVQRYAYEIINALDRLVENDKNEYILLIPNAYIYQDMVLMNIQKKIIGRFKGQLWEQVELPYYSIDGYLVNLCCSAPLMKKQQSITIHDAAVYAASKSFSFMFRNWYKFMYSILARRLSCFFTVSIFSKNELHKYCKIKLDNIHVTYNGIEHISRLEVDEKIINRLNLIGEKYVFAVSSLNPSKNFKLVIKAAIKLPDVQFIIAGGANDKIFNKKNFKVPNNVRFIGYITDSELLALYQNAFCFVYPSLYEGFGIPPIESMMCGCPVIVSDYASLPEVCSNAAIYCNPYKVDSLVESITKLMDNNVLTEKIKQNGFELIKKYNWNIEAEKLLSLIKIDINKGEYK